MSEHVRRARPTIRIRSVIPLIVTLGAVGLVLVSPGAADAATPAACRVPGPESTSASGKPVALTLDEDMSGGEQLQFDFQRDRSPQSDRFMMRSADALPARGTVLATIMSPMRRAGAGGHLADKDVQAVAAVQDSHHVNVTVCIDPADAGEGSYAGAIGFSDDRVTATPVRVVANLQYRNNWYVLIGGFAAAAGAIAMAFLAASDSGERFVSWIKRPRTIVGIGAALIATLGVYLLNYNSDPNWRFDADAWTFLGIAYASALATLGSVLGVAAGKDKSKIMLADDAPPAGGAGGAGGNAHPPAAPPAPEPEPAAGAPR